MAGTQLNITQEQIRALLKELQTIEPGAKMHYKCINRPMLTTVLSESCHECHFGLRT